jgi:hypothetical protein
MSAEPVAPVVHRKRHEMAAAAMAAAKLRQPMIPASATPANARAARIAARVHPKDRGVRANHKAPAAPVVPANTQ